MSYKLYTDKQEIFECNIYLEGASLTKATSRIIVETEDVKLMFEGKIDKDGNCKVPIKKLRGLVSENTTGTMKLEVIADDVYFNPWESNFEVDTSRKIKVEVKGQDSIGYENEKQTNGKPKMVVKEVNHPFDPVDTMVETLKKQKIDIGQIFKSKKRIVPILENYSSKTGYKNGAKNFIKEVIKKLSKK